MVNQEFFNNLNDGSDPEILRTPLDKLILKVNTINENIDVMKHNDHKIKLKSVFGNVFQIFDLCIETIEKSSIEDSINFLLKI